jgi:hypothetical protein
MGTLLDDFLRLMPSLEASFFYGFADHILHSVTERQRLFGATVEEKTRALWHQVHKQGLHTLQTSAWDVWGEISSVTTQT